MKYPRLTLIAAGILTACSSNAWAVKIDYTIDTGVEENSNIAFSHLDPISQRYLRAGLGFAVTEDTSTLQVNLTGRTEYRNYRTDIFDDTLDGALSGRVNWIAIPDRLSFSVEDSLSVEPVDALVPNGPGNRQQINVISLGPNLMFNWSPTWRGRAELRYINSNAEVSDIFNADHVALTLIGSRNLSASSVLSILGQARNVNFDDGIEARDYRRYDLIARYTRDLNHLAYSVDAGYSRIDYHQDAGRSDPLLRAQLNWKMTPRSTMTTTVSREFSDTSSDLLRNIAMAVPVSAPESLVTGGAIINASPYVVRSVGLDYEYNATRLRLSAGFLGQKRKYDDASLLFDQKGDSTYLGIGWTIRPSLTLDAHVDYEKLKYMSMEREDKTLRRGATLRYRMSQNWDAGLSWDRFKRDSTDPGQVVAQNVVYLSISYHNR